MLTSDEFDIMLSNYHRLDISHFNYFELTFVKLSVTKQDKRRLASASDDGTVKIWELASLP